MLQEKLKRSVSSEICPPLIPGIGAQGGDLSATVAAAQDSRGWDMIINFSRDIIYASHSHDFALAAYLATSKLENDINAYRNPRSPTHR